MSLLQSLSYTESLAALKLTSDECDLVASLAKLKNTSYQGLIKPGEKLLNDLNRRGYTAKQYREFISTTLRKIKKSNYRPQIKIAILIGNNNYDNLSKLATPSFDCDSLANSLRNLGFVAVTIKNVKTSALRNILNKIFGVIPEGSYCFIFYAGHGFELCNIKYILCVDSPCAGIANEDCVTENCILKCVSKCKPDLCVLIMDMCRINLDRETNPELYKQIPTVEEYNIDGNLLIIYSTQSAMSAYEMVQIECSNTLGDTSYILNTGDSKMVIAGTSQYVNALCTHLERDDNVSAMFDKVHEDLENAPKKQTPIKVQSGAAKRSLHDLTTGNVTILLKNLKEILNTQDFRQYCEFY